MANPRFTLVNVSNTTLSTTHGYQDPTIDQVTQAVRNAVGRTPALAAEWDNQSVAFRQMMVEVSYTTALEVLRSYDNLSVNPAVADWTNTLNGQINAINSRF